ncbi:collagen alpha-1(XXII) chain-like protein [Pitangus sulphuratus]|nr:collagen alpha-1(XXII) chain-like protein [Pitangus sulphuratus]
MSINFLEHVEEKFTHMVQVGGIAVPAFGKFSVIWRVQQKCWQVVGCKSVHYDLVFLLDASSSVGKEDFEKVRQWVSNLVETFEIGPDKTRVGVVRYSDRPTTEFDLGKYKTREEIKEAARKIQYYGGNTNTGDALRYINTYSFSKEAGGRLSDRTVKKVAILLTDGRSQDFVLDPATAAHQAGIRIFAVGVGEALKEELDEIASEPKSAHVFHVSDYNAIDKIRGKLRRRLCETSNRSNTSRCFLRKDYRSIMLSIGLCPVVTIYNQFAVASELDEFLCKYMEDQRTVIT